MTTEITQGEMWLVAAWHYIALGVSYEYPTCILSDGLTFTQSFPRHRQMGKQIVDRQREHERKAPLRDSEGFSSLVCMHTCV
jgi:hypothetical protein